MKKITKCVGCESELTQRKDMPEMWFCNNDECNWIAFHEKNLREVCSKD